jgi:hypothetical protein
MDDVSTNNRGSSDHTIEQVAQASVEYFRNMSERDTYSELYSRNEFMQYGSGERYFEDFSKHLWRAPRDEGSSTPPKDPSAWEHYFCGKSSATPVLPQTGVTFFIDEDNDGEDWLATDSIFVVKVLEADGGCKRHLTERNNSRGRSRVRGW